MGRDHSLGCITANTLICLFGIVFLLATTVSFVVVASTAEYRSDMDDMNQRDNKLPGPHDLDPRYIVRQSNVINPAQQYRFGYGKPPNTSNSPIPDKKPVCGHDSLPPIKMIRVNTTSQPSKK